MCLHFCRLASQNIKYYKKLKNLESEKSSEFKKI